MKTSRSKTRIAGVVILLLTVMAAAPAWAELIAYDQFADYTDGQLVGQGQGFGWAGNWSGSTNHIVSSTGDLNYGGLETYGGGGSSTSTEAGWRQVNRTLATPITNSGTYYLGFLLQPSRDGTSYSEHAGIRMDAANNDNFRLGAGIWDKNGNWVLRRKNGGGAGHNYGVVSTGITRTEDITHFVIKFEFDPDGSSPAYVYVDPTDAAALTNGTADASFTFTAQVPDITTIVVVHYNNGGDTGTMAYDEIRLGTTPEDMFEPIFRPPQGTVLFIR